MRFVGVAVRIAACSGDPRVDFDAGTPDAGTPDAGTPDAGLHTVFLIVLENKSWSSIRD